MTNSTNLAAVMDAASEELRNALIAIQNGENEKAIEILEAEAKKNPKDSETLFVLSRAYKESGAILAATRTLMKLVKLNPTYHPAYFMLGQLYFQQGMGLQAVECYGQAVAFDIENQDYKQHLISACSAQRFKKTNPNLKGVLIECLEDETLDYVFFGGVWLSIIRGDSGVGPIFALQQHKNFSNFEKAIKGIGQLDGIIEPLFLMGLGKFVINDTSFERWFTHLRRYLLNAKMNGEALFTDPEDWDLITCAMSKYALFTDYIFYISEEEKATLETLKSKIEANNGDLADMGLFACYDYLHTLKNAQDIAAGVQGGDHVSAILKEQIEEHFRQQGIKKNIKNITDIDGDISLAVQEQYEVFPYPRWKSVGRNNYNESIEKRFKGKKAEILIAGCGTGKEPAQMAYVFPDAKITAVDLSATSLAYAIDRCEKLGLDNIDFFQGDIMKLGALDKKFDYIASAGVLHHLEDPKAGWDILHGLLKDDGLMRLAFYSSDARWAINAARKVIQEKGIHSDASSIIDFRQNIDDHLKYKEVQNIQNFFDYYSLTECRDLLFHVQEHQYDLPLLKQQLDSMSMEFLGFWLDGNKVSEFKKKHKNEDDLHDLKCWAKWEEKNPNTFASMYVFWCQNKK